jgi:hypothetical protein
VSKKATTNKAAPREGSVPLLVTFRSHADALLSALSVDIDELRAYLDREGVGVDKEAEIATAVAGKAWGAYGWIEASLRGRVTGTAGADILRGTFRLASACVAMNHVRHLLPFAHELEQAESLEKFAQLLVTWNPGRRDLPPGLNALSGLAMVIEVTLIIERCVTNFRLCSERLERDRTLSRAVSEGHTKRKDSAARTACRIAAAAYVGKNPTSTVAAAVACEELSPFADWTEPTRRGWIKDLFPHRKRGRPRKNK